jgi:hypothetical protein
MKKSFAIVLCLMMSLSFMLTALAEEQTSEDIASQAAAAEEMAANDFTVGSTVIFGAYEQDNDADNGKEAIEWIVLAVDGDRALLLSKYGLDAQKYNTYTKKITWCRCSLRFWLNYNFIKDAFTVAERDLILSTTITNEKPSGFIDAYGCDDTTDQVFLLSYDEALEYLPEDADRATQPTAYAVALGAYVDEENGNCWWWLRSPGSDNTNASGVRTDGRISGSGGREVSRESGCIRPAIWVTIGE